MKICNICNKSFETHSLYANHVRWYHKEIKKENLVSGGIKSNNTRYGEWIHEKVNCSKEGCSNIFEIKYRSKKGPKEKYFCSISCANSRGPRTKEFKDLVSDKIKQRWKEGVFDHITENAQNKRFSSRVEREIVAHFRKNFPDDEWTSGGIIKHNGLSLVRDMYSKKLKVCFEYDGVWHFKDIHGQLKDKQNKDAALEDWCIENEYRLIRVEESSFENFFQIENIIYNNTEKIIKIGKSY